MDAGTSIQDLDETATIKRLTGDTGVFIGGEEDLEAARVRYEAIQAIQARRATPEQRALVNDLDVVLQRASAGPQVNPDVSPAYRSPYPAAPRAMPTGVPRAPRHSRNR